MMLYLLCSHKLRTIFSLSRCAAVNIATLPRSRIYACLSDGFRRSAMADENGRSGKTPSSKSYNMSKKKLFFVVKNSFNTMIKEGHLTFLLSFNSLKLIYDYWIKLSQSTDGHNISHRIPR